METTNINILADKRRFDYKETSIREYGNNKSILVVDDSEDIRELLSVLLHKEGIVYTAANGLDALSKFAGHHFEVVVSDIEMPVMNGIELYRNVPFEYRNFFMFFSGTVKEEYINYLTENNLMLFKKPDDIFKLHFAVQQKLHDSIVAL